MAAAATLTLTAAERTILAIGAHAGDMEVSAGAVLAKHARLGDRVVLLHLTLGEGGNPKVSRASYGEQKRHEALTAAKLLGAEVRFGPYADAKIPRGDEPARFVADTICAVKPTQVITHWKNSIHRDHSLTYTIVNDAVLLAAVNGCAGVQGVWYAENWEDQDGFRPFAYVDVSQDFESWRTVAKAYEFIRGGISRFPYLDYYEALARLRGALSGFRYAVAFDIDTAGKTQHLSTLP